MARATSSTSDPVLPVLQQDRWFSGLDIDFQQALQHASKTRALRHRERLFARGDACDGLYAVVEGAICVTAVSEAGKELMLTRVSPPMWFGEISVLDGEPRTHDAVADGETRVLHVPQAALQKMLDDDPRRFGALARLVTGKLRLAFDVLEDLAALPLTARLARRLVLLAERHGARVLPDVDDGAPPTLEVTQEQLAAMLHSTRQSINSALKSLEQQGLVQLSYGGVVLVDVAGLRACH